MAKTKPEEIKSNNSNNKCDYCRREINENDQEICPRCGKLYHRECWKNNEGCVNYDCSENLSNQDIITKIPKSPKDNIHKNHAGKGTSQKATGYNINGKDCPLCGETIECIIIPGNCKSSKCKQTIIGYCPQCGKPNNIDSDNEKCKECNINLAISCPDCNNNSKKCSVLLNEKNSNEIPKCRGRHKHELLIKCSREHLNVKTQIENNDIKYCHVHDCKEELTKLCDYGEHLIWKNSSYCPKCNHGFIEGIIRKHPSLLAVAAAILVFLALLFNPYMPPKTVIAYLSSNIYQADLKIPMPRQIIKSTPKPIVAIAETDNKELAVATWKDIKIWRQDKKGTYIIKPIANIYQSKKWLSALTITDKDLLISGEWNGRIKVWQKNQSNEYNKKPIENIKAHNHKITQMLLAPNNQLISTGLDDKIKIWQLNDTTLSLEQTLNIKPRKPGTTHYTAITRGDIVVSDQGNIKIWQQDSQANYRQNPKFTLVGHGKNWISAIISTSSGFISADQRGYVKIWQRRARGYKLTQTIKSDRVSVSTLLLSDNHSLVVAGEDSNTGKGIIEIWRQRNGVYGNRAAKTLIGARDWVNALSITKSNRLVSGDYKGNIRIWQVSDAD